MISRLSRIFASHGHARTALFCAFAALSPYFARAEGGDKPLLFLGDSNLAPMICPEDGKPTGLTVDLVKAIATAMERAAEIECADGSTSRQRLVNGDADALIAALPAAEEDEAFDFSKPLMRFRVSGEPIASPLLAIAVRKGNDEFLSAVNASLDHIRRNGTYADVLGKWEPREVAPRTREQADYQHEAVAFILVLVLCLLPSLWIRILRTELDRRRIAEDQWRMLFEDSPVSLWEEDFSAVREYFDILRQAGITDLDDYLGQYPSAIKHCARLVNVLNVNAAAQRLHEAAKRDELLAGITETFAPESFDSFRRELVGLWNGETRLIGESVVKTFSGELRTVTVHVAVCLGYEKTLARVLVSLIDITDRRRNEQVIAESRDMLRHLSAHLDSAREEECEHIAREIHDHLGQMLTAQRLEIATLAFQFAPSIDGLRERCQHLLEITDQTIQAVRDIATSLRPSSLNMGTLPALEWLIGDFTKRTGITCEFTSDDRTPRLDEKQSHAVFRIVQESLTNIARHSGAARVEIAFRESPQGYRLTIRDDGKGFDPAAVSPQSFGLLGIHERAIMAGGNASIVSTPGAGCVTEIEIPRV